MTVRVYPIDCTSAYCGKLAESCPTCPSYPALRAFNQWREATAAKPMDQIWSPLVYATTRPEGGAVR